MQRRGFIWVMGGLALGLGIAFVIGVLVFWVWPEYRKAKSPLGETHWGDIVVRYLKESPVAEEAEPLARKLDEEWRQVLEVLDIPADVLPKSIYVYAYGDAAELPLAFSARCQEEITQLAVVDVLVDQPFAGALARLACSLAYGGAGNPVFPRGLALYLDDPDAAWAAEAMVYGGKEKWKLLFENADRLLPCDPWETFFFKVDAPWVSATPSLETVRWLLKTTEAQVRRAQAWESTAAAFAAFVLEHFSGPGVKAFWLASTWERGARALGLTPDAFARGWEEYLEASFAQAQADPLILAKRDLFTGKPSLAIAHLEGVSGEEPDLLRGLAYLALGEPSSAQAFLASSQEAAPLVRALAGLGKLEPLELGRFVIIGSQTKRYEPDLVQADAALDRALSFWELGEANLPERIAVYLTQASPGIDLPWGVIWAPPGDVDLPEMAVGLVLELVSPLGLPKFDALVQGLALYLSHPERNFKSEALDVMNRGRWVSLTQPLFDGYPRQIAEAEAGAFVSYLISAYGKEGVQRFWKAVALGASPFSAASQVFGLDLYGLDHSLRNWLKQP